MNKPPPQIYHLPSEAEAAAWRLTQWESDARRRRAENLRQMWAAHSYSAGHYA